MKVKQINLAKEFKVGLPNYSNITFRCDMTWELENNEEPDWDKMWDEINRQLALQSNDVDPAWMSEVKEYKNFFKVSVKTKKGGGEI